MPVLIIFAGGCCHVLNILLAVAATCQVCLYLLDVEPLDGFLSFDNAGVATTVVLIVMLQQVLYCVRTSV